jgi:hypothetical protein
MIGAESGLTLYGRKGRNSRCKLGRWNGWGRPEEERAILDPVPELATIATEKGLVGWSTWPCGHGAVSIPKGASMNCYECATLGHSTAAVAACIDCGAGLCVEHAVIAPRI